MSGQPSYLRYFQEPRKQAPASPIPERPPSSAGDASVPPPSSSSNSIPSSSTPSSSVPSSIQSPSNRLSQQFDSSTTKRLSQQFDATTLSQNDSEEAPGSPYEYRRSTTIAPAITTRLTSPSSPTPLANGSLQSPDSDDMSSTQKASDSPQTQKREAKGGLNLFKKKGGGEGAAGTMGKDRVSLVNPQRTLAKDLKNLVNNPDYCDIIFVVEDKPLYAHRCILASRSPKFQQLFNNLKDPRPEIHIPNIRFPVFLAMMYFLYSDSVDVSLEYTLELMGASAHFALDLLKSLCERVLEGSIHVENVCWIFQGADRFKSSRLREVALRFVTRNFDLVSKTTAFQDLDRDLILEIIKSR